MDIEKVKPYYGLIILIIVVLVLIVIVYLLRNKIKQLFSSSEGFYEQDGLNEIYNKPNWRPNNDLINVQGYGSMGVTSDVVMGAEENINAINNNTSDYAFISNIRNNDDLTIVNGPVAESNPSIASPVVPKDAVGFDNRQQPILQTPSNYYLLDDGANGELVFDYNTCSKACCNTNVWPVPFYLPEEDNPIVKDSVPTNMFCTNSISNGCLCATPKQINHIQTRGGNAP